MKDIKWFLVPLVLIAVWWLFWPPGCNCWPWSERLEASARFSSVFNGAAFLDKETGLVWETGQDATQRSWVIARELCMDRNIGDRKGWRLPAFNELTSLIDPTRTNPALPAGHPFQGILNSGYWSASSSALAASPGTHAVGVDLGLGNVSMFNKVTLASVKCVRGRMAGPTIY